MIAWAICTGKGQFSLNFITGSGGKAQNYITVCLGGYLFHIKINDICDVALTLRIGFTDPEISLLSGMKIEKKIGGKKPDQIDKIDTCVMAGFLLFRNHWLEPDSGR
jgi:hypothetical protein